MSTKNLSIFIFILLFLAGVAGCFVYVTYKLATLLGGWDVRVFILGITLLFSYVSLIKGMEGIGDTDY